MRGFLVKSKLLPLFFVISGLLLGYYILHSGQQKPTDFQKSKSKRLRTVQTSQLVKGSVVPFWNTSGFVSPAESVKVFARVSGNIASINQIATPGGVMKKGQWLAKLETVDFELALKSQKAQLTQANASYSLEQADQALAKEELLFIEHSIGQTDALNIDESLVLREPQLTMAKAKVSIAENNVEKAVLNLSRTTVVMPFDGKIISRGVGGSSKVSTNTSLFSVVNTDVYWLEVKIPHKFLTIFDKQQLADVSQARLWGKRKTRQARFVSILPELDNKDRQVKVLLAIDKPQVENTAQPQVFINDFLNVQLKGKSIENAWTIKHSWLQPDNTIWVVDKNKTLQKRHVEVLFKGRDVIYVRTEIQKGDRALAEKPGIVSVGLSVRTRKDLSSSNRERNGKKSKGKSFTKDVRKEFKKSKGLTDAG
jgi:RND family efflux transporter MFP subunit